MSLSQNSNITASDFNTLKSAIYTECARRQIVNPISYTQIGNASAGDSVAASQFVNLATPLRVLDAFTTNGLDTQYYTTATQSGQSEATVTIVNPQNSPAKTIIALESIVNEVKNHAAANNTDCRNNCAGLCTGCSGTCSGGCGGCTGTCSGSCTGCTGTCAGCTGSCTGGCKGCTGTCSGGCAGCTGCSGSCAGCTGCSGGCQGCGSGCAGGCGGCGGNCSGNCWTSCGSDGCSSCQGGCSGGCWSVCAGGTRS